VIIGFAMRYTLCALSVALLVSACSSGVETRIDTAGLNALNVQFFKDEAAEDAPADLKQAYNLARDALISRGFTPAQNGGLLLQVTLDSRDASFALGTSAGQANLSAAKRRKPLQSCADKEFRLGLTMTRIDDGTEIYRSRVAEYHCKMPLADALPFMVKTALADLGQPRGSYLVRRNAVD
jgi:hypothetical protein